MIVPWAACFATLAVVSASPFRRVDKKGELGISLLMPTHLSVFQTGVIRTTVTGHWIASS